MEVGEASSGVINTETRVAMAREKARALGLKVRRPSPLEEEAARLEDTRKAKARKTEEERLRISHHTEAHPFSLQRVKLQTKDPKPEAGDEVGWKAYIPPKQEKNPRPRRIGPIPVMSMAQQIIWRERARGSRRVVADPQARALEEAAMRWQKRKHLGNAGR